MGFNQIMFLGRLNADAKHVSETVGVMADAENTSGDDIFCKK